MGERDLLSGEQKRDYSFSMHAKFFEKPEFLTP